ncbi:MAG TPA: DUF4254 domain-containing protein [Oxalicibacterium sp.]|nr:DUF4254 domain-containing protein [Oxalicibacterium sp.]
MLRGLTGIAITDFHDRSLQAHPAETLQADEVSPIWRSLAANHRCNSLLWDEEDKARRTDVGAAEIAASKRLIDQHNQKRNDAVEALDEAILNELAGVTPQPHARLSSETAGAMIDRLSILALKIFHMREQTTRTDADAHHIEMCRAKYQRLLAQRKDLAFCLDRLLSEAMAGDAYFKVYRQFKMYNDPALNPYLYRQTRIADAAESQ